MKLAVCKMTALEKEACGVARSLGLFFVGSKILTRGKKVDHYRIRRGDYVIAQYWPSNQHLKVCGNRYSAADLIEALNKAAEISGLVDTQSTLPSEPSQQRQPKRKTHRPKNPAHTAHGHQAAKITTAVYLTEDDWKLIAMRLRQASADDEAQTPNMASLDLELIERIEEARHEGARVILEPPKKAGQ